MKTKEPEIVGDLMIYLIPSVSIWRQPSCFASAFRLDFFGLLVCLKMWRYLSRMSAGKRMVLVSHQILVPYFTRIWTGKTGDRIPAFNISRIGQALRRCPNRLKRCESTGVGTLLRSGDRGHRSWSCGFWKPVELLPTTIDFGFDWMVCGGWRGKAHKKSSPRVNRVRKHGLLGWPWWVSFLYLLQASINQQSTAFGLWDELMTEAGGISRPELLEKKVQSGDGKIWQDMASVQSYSQPFFEVPWLPRGEYLFSDAKRMSFPLRGQQLW